MIRERIYIPKFSCVASISLILSYHSQNLRSYRFKSLRRSDSESSRLRCGLSFFPVFSRRRVSTSRELFRYVGLREERNGQIRDLPRKGIKPRGCTIGSPGIRRGSVQKVQDALTRHPSRSLIRHEHAVQLRLNPELSRLE